MGYRTRMIPLLLSLGLMSSCSKEVTEQTAEIFAMNTLISMNIWGIDSNEALQQSENYIYSVEDKFSTTRVESDIYTVNQQAGNWVTVAEEVIYVLDYALTMTEETNNCFSPMMFPLVELWGFTQPRQQVPDPAEIKAVLPYIDTALLEIDYENNMVRIEEGAKLDLGGITKGYVGDVLATSLRDSGVTSALISLGGNIYTLGKKPDGSFWNIGIQNPYGAGSVGSVTVYDRAIITSGGYQRYFIQGDETFWHIIDPISGYPAKSGLASVTIISESGIYGDCLSTALFVMGLEDAIAFWRNRQDFDVVFITDEGDIYITPDLREHFTLSKGYQSGELKEILP